MITINKKSDLDKYLVGDTYIIEDDVTVTFNLDIECNLICYNLNCHNLNCYDLTCDDLNCGDLNCDNLNCGDLNCDNLNCGDLNYWAIAIAYSTFVCSSAQGRRKNAIHKCLDSEIVYRDKPVIKSMTKLEIEKALGHKINIKEEGL